MEYRLGLNKYYSQVCKALEQKANNAKPPGIPISDKRYMTFGIKTSVISYQNKILDYFNINIPFKNILFKYKNIEEKAVRIETMKLFLSSVLGNVREGFLKVTIIDTEGLGRSFSEFLRKELSQYIKVIHTDWEKEFEKLMTMAHEQMLEIGMKSFNQYNEDNDNEGKITLEYNLIIILSTGVKLWENKNFLEFKKYSTDMGVWLWLLHPNESLFVKNKKYPEGLILLMNFPLIVDAKNFLINGKEKIDIYKVDKYSKALDYTVDVGKASAENLIKVFKENRVDIIDYEKEYRLKHIPDSKIWTFSTLNSIELHFGFLDGDRSNPMAETFTSDGTRPVHCLMGGVTGAGKSATINLVLANLLHMYSPEELELIMIDFKNVEFSMYTGKYLIPHAKLIAGTTDGEYALSIFDYLLELMNDRKAKFSKYGFQNIMDWNKAVLSKKINETYMPRILLLCDEFQVMFTEIDNKIVNIIKSRITSLAKLARFAGLHMWFTSQSMSNTMSADILNQFSMRAALRLNDKETSMDLLGNDAAFSKLKGRGFIYVNCDKGNIESNHKYSIPFASNDYIKQYLLKLIDKCEKENHLHRHADFYDEKKRHNINEIDKWYKYKEVADKPYICILGEKTFYSTNRLPVHLHFFQDSYQHLIIAGLEKEDRYNLVCTILYNIEKHNNTFIASCSDREFSDLLNLENREKLSHKDLIDLDNPTKLFDAVEFVVSHRKSNPTKQWSPLYVFCLAWDNMYGIGIGDDYNISDRFKELLQTSGSLGVHFIISTMQSKPFKSYLPYIKHKICSQSDEDTSLDLLDTNKAMKLSEDSLVSRMALYKENLNPVKFKIYQAPIDSTKLQEKETVIL